MQKQTFLLYGRSGSGKGTQAQMLQSFLESQGGEVLYLETGREFRNFIQDKNFVSEKVRSLVNNGGFAPAFLPIWLWTDYLVRRSNNTEHFILDGLARMEHESPVLDSALQFFDRTLVHVVFIDVSADWAFERMMGRGRSDDKPDVIRNRVSAFEHDTVAAMRYFRHRTGYVFHEINGEQTVEQVHNDILSVCGLQ